MLKALYDYGIRNNLAPPPGFVRKTIRGYVLLSKTGDYLAVEKCEDVQDCPDIGSMANSREKCNILAEKVGIILFSPEKEGERSVKSEFFKRILADGVGEVPEFELCLNILKNESLLKIIRAEAQQRKLKDIDRISFKVDGQPLVKNPSVKHWWSQYRKHFSKATSGTTFRCLVTGELTIPLLTVPVMNGLQSVGGNASGSSLICFDKPAYRSYGLKQSTNAPISEEAFAVIKAAYDDLIQGSPTMYKKSDNQSFKPVAPAFAGVKFLHWYDCAVTPEDDPLLSLNLSLVDEDSDDEKEDESTDFSEESMSWRSSERELMAKSRATDLIKSAQNGGHVSLDCQYHILLLSGVSGRIMVRRYDRGNYADLQKNLSLWENDLKLCNNLGGNPLRPRKLTTRLIYLLSGPKNSKMTTLLDRLSKELSGLTPSILMAILDGTPLPDVVAVKALASIRSEMVDPDETNEFSYMPNSICCQWLKAWLLRKERAKNKEATLMATYDSNFPNAAYHCGALIAVYADLQRAAIDAKSGITQRYYASASQAPALVLGQLETMAQYHLAKLRQDGRGGIARIYENLLNQASTFFGTETGHEMPRILTIEQQSYFAIGYRQMCAKMNFDRMAATAAKKEKGISQETTDESLNLEED